MVIDIHLYTWDVVERRNSSLNLSMFAMLILLDISPNCGCSARLASRASGIITKHSMWSVYATFHGQNCNCTRTHLSTLMQCLLSTGAPHPYWIKPVYYGSSYEIYLTLYYMCRSVKSFLYSECHKEHTLLLTPTLTAFIRVLSW